MGRFVNPQHFELTKQDSVWTQKKKSPQARDAEAGSWKLPEGH